MLRAHWTLLLLLELPPSFLQVLQVGNRHTTTSIKICRVELLMELVKDVCVHHLSFAKEELKKFKLAY